MAAAVASFHTAVQIARTFGYEFIIALFHSTELGGRKTIAPLHNFCVEGNNNIAVCETHSLQFSRSSTQFGKTNAFRQVTSQWNRFVINAPKLNQILVSTNNKIVFKNLIKTTLLKFYHFLLVNPSVQSTQ